MIGLSALSLVVAVVVFLGAAYAFGVPGCIGAGVLLTGTWILTIVFGGVDVATFLLEGLTAGLAATLAVRWALRHRAWRRRIDKDAKLADHKRLQLTGALLQLRETVVEKGQVVERALRQYEFLKNFAQAMSWPEITAQLDRAAREFFQSDAWALYLTDEQGHLEPVQREGFTPDLEVEDLSQRDPALHSVLRPDGSASQAVWMLHLPLWRLHERIGVWILQIPEFAPDQRAAIVSAAADFSIQLVFPMSKAKRYWELSRRSWRDPVTELPQRLSFEDRLKEEFARAQAFQHSFSLLRIQIDDFNRLQDDYGSGTADEILRLVARRLRQGLYETDFIATLDQGHFACLLPHSQPGGLKQKAERLRERIAAEAFVIGLEPIQVTLSVGIAHYSQDGLTAEAVRAAAERALESADEAGRNRVIEAESVTPL